MDPVEVANSLKWSAQLDVLSSSDATTLKGDKITLPTSVLETLLNSATTIKPSTSILRSSSFDPFNPHTFTAERVEQGQLFERQQNLPHPLTFRLVNPVNGRIVYAGIREFTAPEGSLRISEFLRVALGLEPDAHQLQDPGAAGADHLRRLTVHLANIPKGSFVRLRPLEPGYDPNDWKALLERYLRDTFTTLTSGEEIIVPAGSQTYRFLIDGFEPKGSAISIVDTDLEVDIEPLSEEQAKETLKILSRKLQATLGTTLGSSPGGGIQVDTIQNGQVKPSEYVDYAIHTWDRGRDLQVELTSHDEKGNLDLLVTPLSQKHRVKPREDQYTFGDMTSQTTKTIVIDQSNTTMEGAEAVLIAVRHYADPLLELDEVEPPTRYHLRISSAGTILDHDDKHRISDSEASTADDSPCSNCHQMIPKRTLFLHQNFCLRNNISCPLCDEVFLKSSKDWTQHWHCDDDDTHGNGLASEAKHRRLFHVVRPCQFCTFSAPNVSELARHRTSTCPGKLILCRFCHLETEQQGPDDPSMDSAEVIVSGLTPHELSDGARTTECHLCSKIVRLRDMAAHLRNHDFQRLSRQAPQLCRNIVCGRLVDAISTTGETKVQPTRNELGLCDACFGPLYVSQYDPEGKALRRRLERKYLTQLLTGCKHSWCRNPFCKTGRTHLDGATEPVPTSKDATLQLRPVLETLTDLSVPMHLCTDEVSQNRRALAEMMAADIHDEVRKDHAPGSPEARYELAWCIAGLGLESDDLNRAQRWLRNFAVTKAEASA